MSSLGQCLICGENVSPGERASLSCTCEDKPVGLMHIECHARWRRVSGRECAMLCGTHATPILRNRDNDALQTTLVVFRVLLFFYGFILFVGSNSFFHTMCGCFHFAALMSTFCGRAFCTRRPLGPVPLQDI